MHIYQKIYELQKIVKGELPGSPDDFQKEKWFQKL
jgi:hypothetical protein